MSKLIASLGTSLLLSLPLAVQAAEKLNVVSWSGYFSPEILAKFQKQTGIEVTVDSYDSNETLLAKLKQGGAGYDVAICMYHDQALIPIKTIDFDGGVNVTLGLPFIRTSPDHGTGYDIAGKGIATPQSLIAALKMAAEMGRNRG